MELPPFVTGLPTPENRELESRRLLESVRYFVRGRSLSTKPLLASRT